MRACGWACVRSCATAQRASHPCFSPRLGLLQRKSGSGSSWGSGSLSLFSLCSGAPEDAVADDAEEAASGTEDLAKEAPSFSDIEAGGSTERVEQGKREDDSGSGRAAAGPNGGG